MVGDRDFWGKGKPFVAGFLRGFRIWLLKGDKLGSTAWDSNWVPGVNVAECQSRLRAMNALQELGIYAACTCVHCQTLFTQPTASELRQARWNQFIDHVAPAASNDGLCNRCGFYGYHEMDSLDNSETYVPGFDDMKSSFIVGSFKATGSVILGTVGFRAEKVEVEALCGNYPRIGKELSRQYNVPWFETREELLTQFPFVPMEGFTYERPATGTGPISSIVAAGWGPAPSWSTATNNNIKNTTLYQMYMVPNSPISISSIPLGSDDEEDDLS